MRIHLPRLLRLRAFLRADLPVDRRVPGGLRDPSGRVVAEVRRGFKENLLRLTDRWDVSIRDPKAVDARMVVMIAAYKSSVDNDRRKEESRKKSSDDK